MCKTLAYRNQIKQAAILEKIKCFGESANVTVLHSITIKKVVLLENHELFLKEAFDTDNLTADSTITIAKSINIQSTMYKIGTVLLISYDENLPLFGIITQIVSSSNIAVYFYCHLFLTLGFEDHFHAFVVRYSENYMYVRKSALYDFRTYCTRKSVIDNENYFICLRNKVCSTKDI